jgi:hypothetical protein
MTEQPDREDQPDQSTPPQAKAKDATGDEPDAQEPGRTDGQADDDLGEDAEQFRQRAENIINFFGSVDASGGTFGGSGPGTARRVTGNISSVEIAVRLRQFVEPEPFEKAKRLLTEQHLVALCGQDGIGKATGALALAAQAADANKPVTRLAPSYTLSDLVDYPRFKTGRAYVVQDWVVGPHSSATQSFDVDVLRRKLQRAGAYLLITTSAEAATHRSLAEVAVNWAPPDPLCLFDKLVADRNVALDAADAAQVERRIGEIRRPADVVAVAVRLDHGVDAAFDVLDDANKVRVAGWFSQRHDARGLLSTAAVAFLSGTPEPVFQQHLSRLVQIVEQLRPGTTTVIGADKTQPGAPLLPQHVEAADDALDEVVHAVGDDGIGLGDRVRQFKSSGYRELVIAELADRYGFELWDPLRQWIKELAALPPSATQVRLALGMALYAKHSPNDVCYSFLDDWAAGLLSERLTAAYLLSWMCIDDGLSAVALRTAVGWVRNAGPRRATTAALAFAGELGIRFPSEALSWLWYLSMRAEAVNRVARSSLGQLCCFAVNDPESITTVLHYLQAALRRLIDEGAGRPEQGRFGAHLRKATSTVFEVLTVKPLGSNEIVTSLILRTLPRNAACLGALWAEVLKSWPHRSEAIKELIGMVDVMRVDDDAIRVIADFGEAVRAGLSADEVRLLREDINQRVAQSWTSVPSTVITLLTAFEC